MQDFIFVEEGVFLLLDDLHTLHESKKKGRLNMQYTTQVHKTQKTHTQGKSKVKTRDKTQNETKELVGSPNAYAN